MEPSIVDWVLGSFSDFEAVTVIGKKGCIAINFIVAYQDDRLSQMLLFITNIAAVIDHSFDAT